MDHDDEGGVQGNNTQFDDKDHEQPHPQQEKDLIHYQFTRDRERRQIRPSTRYSYDDLVYSALVVGVEVKNKPSSYYEAK